MDFDLWLKLGSGPYQRATLEDLFSKTDNACVLVENQQEADILEGFQLIFGGELDIRIIEPESSVNPWSYNRALLFYTFNPLERIS